MLFEVRFQTNMWSEFSEIHQSLKKVEHYRQREALREEQLRTQRNLQMVTQKQTQIDGNCQSKNENQKQTQNLSNKFIRVESAFIAVELVDQIVKNMRIEVGDYKEQNPKYIISRISHLLF